MSIYSTENIEQIITRLLKKEGMSSIVPEDFKTQKENIKLHRDFKKECVKQLKQLRRELSKMNEDETLSFEEKNEKKEISIKIEELDIKIKEKSSAIDEGEKKWNEAIERHAKELLKGLRSRKLIPKIEDFLLFDKTTFRTGDLDSKVIEQLIKEDIAKHYKRKPADRNLIIEQLKSLLDNNLPKCIIRADIKSFFESIPVEKLVRKLEDDGFVSTLTIRYLKKIIGEVKDKGGVGVPRGLSFSSYLTEIYLQRTDDGIKNLPNVYFYQRYVDDIVILLSVSKTVHWPNFLKEISRYWTNIKVIFEKEELSLHEEGDKKSLIYSGKTNRNEFDYLGYKFIIDKGKLEVRLSTHRMDQYKEKISVIIKYYNTTACDNESLSGLESHHQEAWRRRKRQQPLRRLFGQLSALTGNGMLKGPKSNILCGIYYSNHHLTTLKDLEELDKTLLYKIRRDLSIPKNLFRYDDDSDPRETERKIRKILETKWSFVEGFKKRRFCNKSSYFIRLNQIDKLIR